MNMKTFIYTLVLVSAGLLLAACGGAEPNLVATQVAVERSAAATLTAEAPAPQPSPTSVVLAPTEAPPLTPTEVVVEPTAPPTPLPSPTPIAISVLPVDGSDGNVSLGNDHPVKEGRNVTLPGFDPAELQDPMVFRERLVFQVEVRDRSAGPNDGDGIQHVRFAITDQRGQQVHARQENNAGYCVFGGGEPLCNVWRFDETGYRWPDGAMLFPGNYSVVIDITPYQAEAVSWFWNFDVELPQDMARINNIRLQGDRYSVEFETFGFQPQLPDQHVHFFFDTVPPSRPACLAAARGSSTAGRAPSPSTARTTGPRARRKCVCSSPTRTIRYSATRAIVSPCPSCQQFRLEAFVIQPFHKDDIQY